jgi:hypothetical protein
MYYGAPVHYFSYKTTRPGGFLPYFFSPAAQSVTTVSGGADAKTKINRALTEDIKNFRTHQDFDHHPWRNMMNARDC